MGEAQCRLGSVLKCRDPRARYLISKKNCEYWEGVHRRTPLSVTEESTLPIVGATRTELIASGYAPGYCRSSSQTLSGIGNPAKVSFVSGCSGAMPSMLRTITSWRVCWPEC